MKKHILFIISLLNLFGCTREVSIDIPETGILPVVNSIIQTDSIVSLTINQTQTIFQNNPTSITDAVVTLFENEIEKEILTLSDNTFNSVSVIDSDKEYKIKVEIQNFKTVVATEKMVGFPEIASASYKDGVYIGDEGDLFSQAEIEIINTNLKDYFELNMFIKVLNNEGDNSNGDDVFEINSTDLFFDPVLNDVVIKNEGLLGYFPNTLLFSDELMTEGIYTLRINYRPFIQNFYDSNIDEETVLIMKLRKVSQNYYNYKKTLTQHLESQSSDIWDGVGQPLPVFTNIENGYGIFAGYSQIMDTIQKQ